MSDKRKGVVLCATKGFLEPGLPRVLTPIGERTALSYVLAALSFLPPRDTVLVLGGGGEKVKAAFPGYGYAFQSPQLGSGHAVQCAEGPLAGFEGDVLVCRGDMPLLRRERWEELWDIHEASGAACTVLDGAKAYIFRGGELGRGLTTLRPDEVGLYHLSQVLPWLEAHGERVEHVTTATPEELLRVNGPGPLAQVRAIIEKQEEIV